MTTKSVDPHYARTAEYHQQLQEIEQRGVCPFCPENFDWHPYPIQHRVGRWFITTIRENYENAAWHFLIIGDKHKESILQLEPADWADIGALAKWATRRYKLRGGALTLRFGPTSYTGATVQHLHAHLIEPSIDPATGRARTVNFPIG